MKTGFSNNAMLAPELSAELPVEQLYNQAVANFIETHGELAKLPQDKNDPLPELDAALRSLGVERDNDCSMFIMGAMGKVGFDAAEHAMGMSAASPASAVADFALGYAAERADERVRNESKAAFKRANNSNTRSVFEKPRFKRATHAFKKQAPGAQAMKQKFATSMLMGASMAKKPDLRASMQKRQMLKKALEKSRQEIELLDVFKKSGYKYARRVNKKDANGQMLSMLVPVETAPHLVLTAKERKQVDMKSTYELKRGPKAPGMALAA